jgi:hypothetical protein
MIYSLAMPWTSIPFTMSVDLWGLEVMTERTRVMPASRRACESRARRLCVRRGEFSEVGRGDEGGIQIRQRRGGMICAGVGETSMENGKEILGGIRTEDGV